jgi:hypothetical protein
VWILATATALLAVLLVMRLAAKPHGEVLASTECPFLGEPRITVNPRMAALDTLPVRKHEETHAAQCRELGPIRYRIRNLTTRGRLSLEAPGYCAGARARLEMGMEPRRVRERLLDDIGAAFAGSADTAAVRAALRAACPEVLR